MIYYALTVLCAAVFYFCFLRVSKSYKLSAVCGIVFLCAVLFLKSYVPRNILLSLMFMLLSFFCYTFIYAKGLKHNQDKHFLLVSSLLYAAAFYFSAYSVVLIIFLACYDLFSVKTGNKKNIFLRMAFFAVITAVAAVLKLPF